MSRDEITLENLNSRFWPQVEITEGCWWWLGLRNNKGYGRIGYDYKSRLAHKVAWFLMHGTWPRQLNHACNNGAQGCVNPGHLYPGTQKDNARDKLQAGRQARGETHGRAKVSAEQVRQIRYLYEYVGGYTQGDLARAYGISQVQVSHIVTSKAWKEGAMCLGA